MFGLSPSYPWYTWWAFVIVSLFVLGIYLAVLLGIIKGVSPVNISLGYHGIPSADRMYLSVVRTSWTLPRLRPTPRCSQDIVDTRLRGAMSPLVSQALWAQNGCMPRSFHIAECAQFQKLHDGNNAAQAFF